jgi:hypothetical protein
MVMDLSGELRESKQRGSAVVSSYPLSVIATQLPLGWKSSPHQMTRSSITAEGFAGTESR